MRLHSYDLADCQRLPHGLLGEPSESVGAEGISAILPRELLVGLTALESGPIGGKWDSGY